MGYRAIRETSYGTVMDEKALQGIIGSLLTARNDAKKQTATFNPNLKSTFQVVALPGGTFVLGSEGISCADHAVELIASDAVLGERFSRAFVSDKINRLILTLLGVSDQDLQANTEKDVRLLVKELETTPVLQWTTMLPIANLVLKIPPLQIGRVTLTLIGKALMDSTFSAFSEINETTISPQEVKDQGAKAMSELLQNRYLNKAVATVTVDAADQNSGVQHGEKEIEHSLNALRFYGRAVMKNDARLYRMFIGPEGTIFTGSYTTICFIAKQQFALPSRRTGYSYPYEINPETLDLMKKLWLSDLSKILAKHERERTSFEKLLVTAVDLFGIAMDQPNPREAYLNFVTSLESLLLKEKEPRGLLAERVAIIVGETFDARQRLFNYMEHIYDFRSKIVHSGLADVTEDDLGLVSMIAFHAILRLVSASSKINDIGKLVLACSKSKFSGPPFGAES
jgi:hypothetical protein